MSTFLIYAVMYEGNQRGPAARLSALPGAQRAARGGHGDGAGTPRFGVPAIHLHADSLAISGSVERRTGARRQCLATGDEHGVAGTRGTRPRDETGQRVVRTVTTCCADPRWRGTAREDRCRCPR